MERITECPSCGREVVAQITKCHLEEGDDLECPLCEALWRSICYHRHDPPAVWDPPQNPPPGSA